MRIAAIFPALLLLGLAACAPATVDPRQQLSRAQLDRVKQPLLLADLETPGIVATLVIRSQSNGTRTWITADKATLSFTDGILTATRGLGADLMSADVSNTRKAVRAGVRTGYYTRFHSYLDGENQTWFRSLQCRITDTRQVSVEIIGQRHNVRLTEESCASPDETIINRYWRGSDGVMWKARQWVGPDAGYLTTERLVR